jgi:hypothetical protein
MQCNCMREDEKCMICCHTPSFNGSSDCKPIHKIYPKDYSYPLYMQDGRSCHNGLCEKVKHNIKDNFSRFI